MSEPFPTDQTPRIEVRVYRDDELVETHLCDSEEEAAVLVDRWADVEEVTCLVDDLSFHHGPEDVLAPEPAAPLEEDYPHE